MSGLLLNLSGPMQSWGSQSQWTRRDTHDHPTRSGLIGLLGAVIGHDRRDPLDIFAALEFTSRIDRPGHRIIDFHTVGGGRAPEHTAPLAGGGRRPAGQGTIVSNRHYLSDAAFTVAVTSTDDQLLERIADGFARPTYTPSLGRRSCPPAGALFLGRHTDPVTALSESIPLARIKPRDNTDTVTVDFVTERPPPAGTIAHIDTVPTQPHRVDGERVFRQHTTWRWTHTLPATLCAGLGIDYLNNLLQRTETT